MPLDLSKTHPTTLEEAISTIYDSLTEVEKGVLRSSRGGISARAFTFGAAMRNWWELWKDGTVLRESMKAAYGLGHAEDLSAMILNGVDAKLAGQWYDAKEKSSIYRDFWVKRGMDPLEAGNVPVQEQGVIH